MGGQAGREGEPRRGGERSAEGRTTADTDTHGDSPCDGDRPLRPVRSGLASTPSSGVQHKGQCRDRGPQRQSRKPGQTSTSIGAVWVDSRVGSRKYS
ncbi:hypothetical protein BSLA_03r0124 [Burkholderia stabilis]|nr:hypothetical protein BSLA_03r0124 [Burkholderia stabilis]